MILGNTAQDGFDTSEAYDDATLHSFLYIPRVLDSVLW